MINIRMNNVDHSSKAKLSPKITVVGVGGAGGNAVNNMISTNLNGVDFVVCNTDSQALSGNLAEHKVQLGTAVTEGLGAGAKPEIGKAAAEESLDDVMQYLDDANMVFITAGMGGGTGTGAAAVIAKACRERGILTVGVVTKPFHFEGTRRMRMAEDGLSELQNYVDTLIVIPNQNLFRVVNDKTTFADGFKMADSVLQSAVRGVTDLIVMPGLINLDFADIRSVMQEMGKAVMGAGEATGDNRATEAAEKAISNPLLDDVSMKGAKGVIVNITGGYDMTLFEVDEACNRIRDEVDPDANIIFGSTFDESLEGTIRVSVVATGIDAEISDKKTIPSSRGSVGGFSVERARARAEAQHIQAQTAQVHAAPAYQPQPQPVTQPVSVARPVNQQPTSFAAAARPAVPAASAPSYYQQELQVAEQAVAPKVAVGAEGAMRGTRMGESYIPPQPVEVAGGFHSSDLYSPQAVQPRSYQPQPMPQQAVPVAQAPVYQAAPQHMEAMPAQHYQESPAAVTRKKSPSLFERITSGYRRHEAPAEDFRTEAPVEVQDAGAGTGAPYAGNGLGLRAPQRSVAPTPSQGRLNIDAPSAPKSEEDELDIPAFLRRQTS